MSSAPRVLGEGRYVRLLDEDGWEYITRHAVTGVVVLVAITPAREIVLVEQYRRAVHGVVVELPAGLVGDTADRKAESLATAAHRELLEETGFRAREMVEVAQGPIAVGFSDEIVTFFEARGIERVGPGGGDETENITVQVVPIDGLAAFLDERRAAGLAIDPKIFAGLYLAGVSPPSPAKTKTP